jgi:glycosyltransferase involved in cell wall biosynthesis
MPMMRRLVSLFRPSRVFAAIRDLFRSLFRDGVRITWQRIVARLKNRPEDPRTLYENHRRAQYEYVRAYARSPLKQRRAMLEDLLRAEHGFRGIVLYPVSYKLEIRQRPEHLLRGLAAEGYLCLMLTIGSDVPFVRRHGPRLYSTSLYEDALVYFRHQRVALYVTFPGHQYVTRFLERAIVVYDVLDRLQIFAGYCPAMVKDHQALLAAADLVLCSAPPLYEETAPLAKRCLLVQNGVWAEDFATAVEAPAPPPVVVGYYGAISELLDFDLLDEIAELPGVQLALAGPIAAFKPEHEVVLQTRTDGLFARKNVKYHGVLAYGDLSRFMGSVHCALVPFVVTHDTDAVSPLKLFEYLAAGKPVLATPTRNMRLFADAIFVGDAPAIVARIREGRWGEVDAARSAALLERHTWHELLQPVQEALAALEPDRTPAVPATPGPRRVDIVNVNFFDWNGETVYKGGAERYVHDLAKLCQRLGCTVRILQNANFAFTRRFRDIEVIGLPIVRELDFTALSRGFAEATLDADLVIASPLELASRFFPTRKLVGINHGIHWDARTTRVDTFSTRTFRLIQESLQRTDVCVCVDTNFINWVRSFEWRLAQQLQYVPNYVDTGQFRPVAKDFAARRLTVLYPRRLYDPRGFHETLDAFDFLSQATDQLQLHLCGQAEGQDAERARAAVQAHKGRISWYELPMEEMQQAYQQSHIVLVPTMYAEGTSLSCIEAMATNNAVIATNVGGLPNLVSDGYSGLLIRPDTWDIVAALRRLLADRELAARLARHALGVAESLDRTRWEERWTALLEPLLRLPERQPERQAMGIAV